MTISLERIDPDNHMARYYRMTILPDLFGGFLLIREWGRIDAKGGQEMREFFEDEGQAIDRCRVLAEAKRKRGYC